MYQRRNKLHGSPFFHLLSFRPKSTSMPNMLNSQISILCAKRGIMHHIISLNHTKLLQN